MRYLVTGAAGFIGFHCCQRLLAQGHDVIGIDNLNAYYDQALKRARLALLAGSWTFHELDIVERAGMEQLFARGGFERVIHLAAQAGVRASLTTPETYFDTNLVGFGNVITAASRHRVGHFVYASSSSVYGLNATLPFSTHKPVDHPLSLYAATKKANELMAHAYSHLYGLPATGLRFFTVYGPWGRPDMAMFVFAQAIAQDQPIKLFNYGHMRRDFTYIDDVVQAVDRLIDKAPVKTKLDPDGELDPASSAAPWRIYNIGNNRSVEISRVVELLEHEFGRKARAELVPMQPGDVPETCADIDDLMRDVGFRPATSIEDGVRHFAVWYRDYHRR